MYIVIVKKITNIIFIQLIYFENLYIYTTLSVEIYTEMCVNIIYPNIRDKLTYFYM